MIKLKHLLIERSDYLDTANQIIKSYNLKSKVKFGKVKSDNRADYDWATDTINLQKSYKSVKDFVITVLHEIDHAKDAKKMGVKKYEKEYTLAGQEAEDNGGDFHDDNFYEEKAERWARQEYSKRWSKKFK